MNTPKVTHDPAGRRFEADVGAEVARCEYQLRAGRMDIVHTAVPRAAQGQGVAGALVREALAWARREGLRVRPACSYAARYMREHPETHDLLDDDSRFD